jgi:hypothetical protein
VADEPSEEALTPDCPAARALAAICPLALLRKGDLSPVGVVKEGVGAKVQEFLIYQPKT